LLTAHGAFELTRQSERAAYGPGYGYGPHGSIGVVGGSSGHVGVGISIGISSYDGYGPPSEPPAVRALARIRVPDPAAYRRSARDWSIVVTLGDGSRTPAYARIPAPLPSAPAAPPPGND